MAFQLWESPSFREGRMSSHCAQVLSFSLLPEQIANCLSRPALLGQLLSVAFATVTLHEFAEVVASLTVERFVNRQALPIYCIQVFAHPPDVRQGRGPKRAVGLFP